MYHFFYPRSPCGERPAAGRFALRNMIFLSTLSLRRATLVFPLGIQGLFIFYPRSPCGERLKGPDQQHERHLFFYPRSPCGERRLSYAL